MDDVPSGVTIVQGNSTVNCVFVVNTSDEDSLRQTDENAYLYVIHICFCVISIAISLLNILIFTRPSLRSSSINTLFLAIEVSNLILSLHYLPVCVMKYAFPVHFYFQSEVPRAQTYIEIVLQASVCFTVWLTAVVAVWRCIAVVWPLKAHCHLTQTLARYLVVGLALFSLFIITTVYLITLHVYEIPFTVCIYSEGEMIVANLNLCFLSVFHLIQSCYLSLVLCVVFFVIPTVLSIAATVWMLWTIRISMQIRKSMQGSTDYNTSDTRSCVRTTVVLTIMLFAFSVMNFCPYVTPLILLVRKDTALPSSLDYIFSEYLLGLAVNCLSTIGFCFIGTKFRETLLSVLTCWRKEDRQAIDNRTTSTNLNNEHELYLPE